MLRQYSIVEGKLVEETTGQGPVFLYINPTDDEHKKLIEEFQIDAHTLACCLDPNELGRLEFEPSHAALIIKRPKRYSSEDEFLLKVLSIGLFLFNDRLVIVATEEGQILEGRVYQNVHTLSELVLKITYTCILHFEQHLQVIRQISDELEDQINRSMDNKHLLFMFNLEKSLVYYLSAISSNSRVIERLKANALKLNFTNDEKDLLDDAAIENAQCYEQGNVYSHVLASMMDARVSVVGNNLNILIKRLTIYMISIMVASFTVSVFSMNVRHPFSEDPTLLSFWAIIGITALAAYMVLLIWRLRRW